MRVLSFTFERSLLGTLGKCTRTYGEFLKLRAHFVYEVLDFEPAVRRGYLFWLMVSRAETVYTVSLFCADLGLKHLVARQLLAQVSLWEGPTREG